MQARRGAQDPQPAAAHLRCQHSAGEGGQDTIRHCVVGPEESQGHDDLDRPDGGQQQ